MPNSGEERMKFSIPERAHTVDLQRRSTPSFGQPRAWHMQIAIRTVEKSMSTPTNYDHT